MCDLGKKWRLSDSVLSQFREPDYLGAWNRLPTSVHLHYHAISQQQSYKLLVFFQHGHSTDIISFKQNIQSDELL